MIEHDLRDKTIIVTGANSGIGKATAAGLAGRRARVVMICRSRERGEKARAEIVEKSGNENVDLLLADFADQAQVRRLAGEILARYDRLDALVNNAGLYLEKRTLTEDGYEMTFAVNHLAPFLLTNLLLEKLKASAPSRIVNVTSAAHFDGRIHFDDLHRARRYRVLSVYGQSKLANVLFTYELARRLEGTGVTANCIHPGVVATRIWSHNTGPLSLIMQPFKLFMMRPKKAARPLIRLAVAPELAGVTGKYFDKGEEKRSAEASYDEALAERLWQVSEEMTGLAG